MSFRRIGSLVLVTVVYLAIAGSMHLARGAVDSDFGANNDEPAHLVTGLMMHDYFVQRDPLNPILFAENYYLHYPKVMVGQYPPGFYVIMAAWTIPFGTSNLSIITLMSLLAALVATVVFVSVRREVGGVFAWGTGLLFLLLPLVQHYSGMVSLDVSLALFCTLATLELGRFIDTGKTRYCITFGLLAAFSILVRGSALALAPVPVLALLLAGRLDLLKKPGLWLSAAIVIALCAPWYAVTLGMASRAWAGGSSPSWEYASITLPYFLRTFLSLGGIGVGAMVALGMVVQIRDRQSAGKWFTAAAFLPSLLLLHCVIPANIEDRYMIPAAPAWLMFFAAGTIWLSRRVPWPIVHRLHVVPLFFLGVFAVEVFEFPRKDVSGFGDAARAIVADPGLVNSVLMIASDGTGEGVFVSAVALSEERLGHIVLRASNVLCDDDFYGRNYHPHYSTTAELMERLREIPVGLVALDHSIPKDHWTPHHDLLERLMKEKPDVWQLVGTHDVVRGGRPFEGALELYRQVGHELLPRTPLTIDDVLHH